MSDSSSLVRCHHSCFRVDRGQGIAIRARSRGFVHIFFILAVCLGISVWGISEVLRYVTETRQTAEQSEIESLHRARQALINYAFLPPPDLPGQDGAFNVFGFRSVVNNSVTVVFNQEFRHYELPCPDVLDVREVRDGGEVYIGGSEVDEDGDAAPRLDGIADYSGLPVCGQTDNPLESGSWVGRFPWRSLSGGTVFVRGAGGEDLRDSAKERLWYAVSPNLLPSDQPRRPPLNFHYLLSREDWLTVTDARGEIVSDRVAAVVIAPREQSGEHVFRLFEDTPRSGSPTPEEAAAAYLDEENRDGDRVFVNSDSYRASVLGPESDANQTLDLLARVHIEDFINDRIPNLGSRLCESAAGGDSAAIEVLRAHLIQRGSLPDPAVFEEAAATVAYRLPGFSPSRGDAVGGVVTVAVLGVSTTVNPPAELGQGRLETPDLLLYNPGAGIRLDTNAVFPGDITISGFQLVPRRVYDPVSRQTVTRYAVQHRSVGGDLNINTTVRSDDLFDPGDSSVPFFPAIHGFPMLDSNFNSPAYGIVETPITTGVAVRASLIRRGATVVGDGVEVIGVRTTVEARLQLFVDGDSLPPFFIWPGSSIAINALLDLDPNPPFNAAIAALETRYVVHNESRVSTMLALADPGFASHLPLALFGEGGSAPTFAEPFGGATQSCYTTENARARTLNEGALVMALARPRDRIFQSGSLSRLVKKVAGEGVEDSPIDGAGVLLPPGTVLRVQFDADNTGDLILPSGYRVCGDVSDGSLVVGGALGARSVPVRVRTEAVAEVLSGGGEPDADGVERPGGARPGAAAVAGNVGFFPIHSIDDQFPQNYDRVNPFYRVEQFDSPRWARLSGETFGFFPCGANLAFLSDAVIRGAPIAPARGFGSGDSNPRLSHRRASGGRVYARFVAAAVFPARHRLSDSPATPATRSM